MNKFIVTTVMALASLYAFGDVQSQFTSQISTYQHDLAAGNYVGAAKAVAAASQSCASVKNYDGAFKVLQGFENTMASRHITPDSIPSAYYELAKARFDLYQATKNTTRAENQLQKMVQLSKASGSRDAITAMLFSAAQYYYSVNQPAKGDKCISQLIKQYDSESDYQAADKAYKTLIAKAVSSNDASMVEHTYESYMAWGDSVAAANANTELAQAKRDIAESQATIVSKDNTIKSKTAVIVTFIALFAGALACLGFGVILYRRALANNRRLRRSVEEANAQSAAKSAILHNMSSTMAPSLQSLDSSLPAVKSLKDYVERVEELSDVGDSQPKSEDELTEVDLQKFCNEIADEIRPRLREGVDLKVDVPRSMAKIDTEETAHILRHLLSNAAKYTPENGRIRLTYKKRGAKVHQFSVADSGPGIPKDKRDVIFTPFSTPDVDITKGDGLGLPICALRASKLNGDLQLDNDHAVGATFVLTLRS